MSASAPLLIRRAVVASVPVGGKDGEDRPGGPEMAIIFVYPVSFGLQSFSSLEPLRCRRPLKADTRSSSPQMSSNRLPFAAAAHSKLPIVKARNMHGSRLDGRPASIHNGISSRRKIEVCFRVQEIHKIWFLPTYNCPGAGGVSSPLLSSISSIGASVALSAIA